MTTSKQPEGGAPDRARPVRDRGAEARDGERESSDAAGRDARADARDVAAEQRDRVAEVRELALSGVGLPALISSTAATDRAAAATDREAAAGDRAQAALDRFASSFDDLTQAYRRTPGMVEARRELARARRAGQPLALAFVDVDGLKDINDHCGHLEGDALLVDVVREIRLVLRDYDLVVRYGGDEFVCVLSDTSAADAIGRFDAVNAALAQRTVPASVSVGAAEPEAATETIEDLLARADAALYRGRAERGHHPS